MDCFTISENFSEFIGDGWQVRAALFTTYNFEPEFFEQEIIPLLLDREVAYSSDARIKSIQVREALTESGLPIEVFYDRDIVHRELTVSPAMEYLHHGIRGDTAAFHAKLTVLLVEDTDTREQSLVVGAGSANLTQAGWWENVECQHWEEVYSGEVNNTFLDQLRKEMEWLSEHRPQISQGFNSALDQIRGFLERCRGAYKKEPVSYYGLTGIKEWKKKAPAFINFLKKALDDRTSYNKWSLEIISPYFAEDPEFDAHKHFFNDMGVGEIRLFLPMDEQGRAICQQDYFQKVVAEENIGWATWSKKLTGKLGLKNSVPRTTHAKIYHFYNGKQSWAFVGSVNFTYKAISDNQEAGFFTSLSIGTELLVPLEEDEVPDKCCPEENLSGEELETENEEYPQILFDYDWKHHRLTAVVVGKKSINLEVISPEREVKIDSFPVDENPKEVNCNPDIIESLLESSGFLRVRGHWLDDGKPIAEHPVLVQQRNWSHKPLNLPHLTPQEILQIYAGLSQLRRIQIIEHLKERQLREKGLVTEGMSSTGYEEQGRQFFAEYAELFHAFRTLRQRLEEAHGKEEFNKVDYYLSGRGLDSLPTLIESLDDEECPLDAVSTYLTLLCLVQVYETEQFSERQDVRHWLVDCRKRLESLEASVKLRLIADDDPERRKRFFAWYRKQFRQEYRPKAEESDLESR